MASGKLQADGSTPWVTVQTMEGAKTTMFFAGDFGGGTVTIQKEVNGVAYSLLDSGTAITFTDDDDSMYNLAPGTKVRGTLSGSTTPDINWMITGL